MKTSKRSYAMAMLAGLAIIGAATAGVSIAESHQADAAAELPAAPAVSADRPTSDTAATGAASAPPATAGASSAGGSTAAADSASATTPPTTTGTAAGASSTSTPAPTTEASGSRAPRTTAQSPAAASTLATSSAPPKPVTHMFKDGQYSATGMYNSPGGTQHLGVTITVALDTVTAAKLDLLGQAGVAHSYQTLFASGYSAQVIGKNIASVKLGAVAGSSLTGIGFNMALQQIESQAHA